jgi:hypothetical protein
MVAVCKPIFKCGYPLTLCHFYYCRFPAPKSRITNVEVTVVQKLNQGTISKSGCNRFGVPFFGYFFVEHPEKGFAALLREASKKVTKRLKAVIIYFTVLKKKLAQFFNFFIKYIS